MKINKKTILIITIILFGLIIIGSSYALWTYTSSNRKRVGLWTSVSGLKNYIIYDDGQAQFVGNLGEGESIHATISINKNTNDIDLTATINMNVNVIGATMKTSPALKWKVTSGDDTTFYNTPLASGDFVDANAGDVIPLVDFPVQLLANNNPSKYTIWIWLDSNEEIDPELTGETLDVDV